MKRQIFLSICCIASLSLLQACSESDGDNNPWSSPSQVFSGSNITSSKVSSNNRGDIVLIWEETEEQVRIDQALTDAHDASIPYAEDAAISPDRDMDPHPDVFEAYDSSNPDHRADAKMADYGGHDTHVHVDIYSRLNVKTRVYSASRGSWLESVTLQTGFWQRTQKGNRPLEDSSNEQITVTDNVSSLPNTHISSASSSSGNGVVAWIQVRESLVAGDAGDEYDIYTAQYSAANTSWTAPEILSLSSVSEKPSLKDLALSLDANDNVQLLWIARHSDSSNSTHVYQAEYDKATGVWSGSTLLSDSSTSADSVKIVMFDDDSGVAVWSSVNESAKSTYVEQDGEGDLCIATPTICDGTQTNLYANWFDEDGWQATPALISDALGDVGEFDISSNDAGAVWVAWEQHDAFVTRSIIDGVERFVNSVATNAKINVSQFDVAANTWSATASVHQFAADGSYENNKQPSIAIDSSGAVMVAWSQDTFFDFGDDDSSKWNNSQREAIWMNVFKTDWQGAQQLAADERFSFVKPKVAAVEEDKFSVVWRGWSVSNGQSGHQLFSLDYTAATNSFSQRYTVNSRAGIIEDVFLFNTVNRLKLIWLSDQDSLQTVQK